MDDRVAVNTHSAVLLEHVCFVDGFFKIRAFDGDRIVIFDDFSDFPLDHGGYFAAVNHPLARHADDDKLIALDFVFNDMGNNITGITSFGQNADFLGAIRQIIAQVNAAIAVPDEVFHRCRGSGKMRFVHQRDGSLAESDDHFHLAFF